MATDGRRQLEGPGVKFREITWQDYGRNQIFCTIFSSAYNNPKMITDVFLITSE